MRLCVCASSSVCLCANSKNLYIHLSWLSECLCVCAGAGAGCVCVCALARVCVGLSVSYLAVWRIRVYQTGRGQKDVHLRKMDIFPSSHSHPPVLSPPVYPSLIRRSGSLAPPSPRLPFCPHTGRCFHSSPCLSFCLPVRFPPWLSAQIDPLRLSCRSVWSAVDTSGQATGG